MKIVLAKHCGFCYGVKRAVDMAMACSNNAGGAYTLGPIIHNNQVVERLRQNGIKQVDTLSDVDQGKIIIRSHGVGPSVYASIENTNLELVDATCPNVKAVQQQAQKLVQNDYILVVVGDKDHPEVVSILEWSGTEPYVVATVAETEKLPQLHRIGVVAQTTFDSAIFARIVEILRTKCEELKVERTICQATDMRQMAAIALAKQSDVMVVIGGKNSANTSRLAEICRNIGVNTFHIETAAELEQDWFNNVNTAGITAGASTPDWLIEEVYQKMQEMNEEVANDVVDLNVGNLIKGKVTGIQDDIVMVDIGYKTDGIIEKNDLAVPVPASANDVVSIGQELDLVVTKVDDDNGVVKLSKVKADVMLAWKQLEQIMEQGSSVEVYVQEVVKGGLSVYYNSLRGFIPASQVYLKYAEDFSPLVGQTLTVKVMEVNSQAKKLIFSHKSILKDEMMEKRAELLASLQPGKKITGIVSRIATFGAFVDLGCIDGLIHISDLSWQRVAKPEDVVAVGDEVEVTILKVDQANQKVSLCLKDMKQDPWFTEVKGIKEGTTFKGKVTKLASFGAFIELLPGVEGLVHISEISEERVNRIEDVLKVGQEVTIKVLGLDKTNKRISLSIAQAKNDVERAEFKDYLSTQHGLNLTIGDKLGHLFKRED